MRRVAVAAAFLILVLPGAAHADWGWTHWGMDVSQVVKASRRAVRPIQGDLGQQVNGWDLRAAGKTRQDGLKFTVGFYFDPDGQALHVVKLTPRLRDCPALLKRLTDLYGAPKDASIILTGSRPITFTLLKWQDPVHGNFVAYSENPDVGNLAAGCFVRYRPIAEPDPPS